MKILELTINNFMAIGSVNALPLDDRGLILIQGENKDDTSQDSNGAGKSSIAEALCWCLYGETARGETGDAVINDTAKKNTEVVIKLLDETGAIYRVSRYRKHKPYKNMVRVEVQEGESWKDLTKGTDKLTQAMLDKIIGCTHEVFASAIYAGQEAMPDLPGMTDKQLKVLVEEAAGINELQEAFEIAKSKMAAVKIEVSDLSSQIGAVNMNVAHRRGVMADLINSDAEWHKQHKADIASLKAQIETAKTAYDPSLSERIEAKISEIDGETADIKSAIAGTAAERSEEARLRAVMQKAVIEAGNAEHSFKMALAAAQQAKHALDHVDGRVGEACGSCGHILEAGDLADAKSAAHKQATEKATAAKQAKSDLQIARERAENASDAHTAFVSTMTDITSLTQRQSVLEANRSRLMSAFDAEAGKLNHLTGLEKALTTCEGVTDSPYVSLVDKEKVGIEALTEQLTDLTEQRKQAEARLTLHEEAVRVFGPAGVRAHILDTVTPYLNVRTSHYLGALTDGNINAVWSTVSTTAKGELREKFCIDVESGTGAKTFKGLSGGEKRKVRLACAMALQDLVSSRASKPIKLFVADEIDHALDPAGLERLMTILEEKANDKGTVLVISHSDLTDWIKSSITVTKKGGQSTLVGSCL